MNTTSSRLRQIQHLVAGSGGSRTILSSAGSILALSVAGMTSFSTIGGISGGAITSLLLSAGYAPSFIARAAIEIDYQSLLTPLKDKKAALLALAFKDFHSWVLPSDGVYATEQLGDYIDSLVTSWPRNFWTSAISKDAVFVFTSSGVIRVAGGETVLVSSSPTSVGFAIRATCSVPGLMAPAELLGEPLFDGVLSSYKRLPLKLPGDFFNAAPETVLGLDAGEEPGWLKGLSYLFWGVAFNGPCWLKNNSSRKVNPGRSLVIAPRLGPLPGLRFSLPAIDKWSALYAGLLDGLMALDEHDLLDENGRLTAFSLRTGFKAAMSQSSSDADKIRRLQELLSFHQLY